MNLEDQLPDWSKSVDPQLRVSYDPLRRAALSFIEASEREREEWVRQVSAKYCFPRFNLGRASGIYLLFRLTFDLPVRYPREETRVFGGWLHLSTTRVGEPFDLSWPITIDLRDRSVQINRFLSYKGKGYDALGEYQYFSARFQMRTRAELEQLKFVP